MIEIYYAAPSIYGRKILAVLEEKSLDYEIKKLPPEGGGRPDEENLKLDIRGGVPTLVDEGFIVYESTAIAEYLNDEYPYPPLLPEDSQTRALARMIDGYCEFRFYPDIMEGHAQKSQSAADVSVETKGALAAHLKKIEDYLGRKEYPVGVFSIADCSLMPVFASLEALTLENELVASQPLKEYRDRLKTHKGYKGASIFSN